MKCALFIKKIKSKFFKKNPGIRKSLLFILIIFAAISFIPNMPVNAVDGYRLCKYNGKFGYYSYEQCAEEEAKSKTGGDDNENSGGNNNTNDNNSEENDTSSESTENDADSDFVFAGLSQEQIDLYKSGVRYFDIDVASNNCGTGSSELEGHKLPAVKGGSAVESQYDSNDPGYIYRSGALDGISNKDLYIKYGMNMRFDYVKANWHGNTSDFNNKELSWLAEKPRFVLVTNPRNGKSVRTVALDYGPAPWTGTKAGSSNVPSYWNGFYHDSEILANHPEYKGRVSGISSTAAKAIDMKTWVRESGDELEYSWSDDQESPPGPTDETSSSTSSSSSDECSNIHGNLAFPLNVKKKEVNKPTPSSHNYQANDLMAKEGTEVIAFQGGKVTFANQNSTPAAGKPGGPRANISITNDDLTVTYIHLAPGSLKFANGDKVKVGDVIGKVGNTAAADNTPPHLHIDAVDAKGGPRPSCSRLNCPQSNKNRFIDLTSDLVKLYEKLPEK